MVNLTPNKKQKVLEPVIVVEYQDGEIRWFERVVEKELMFYLSSGGATAVELSSLADPRKWERKKRRAMEARCPLFLCLSLSLSVPHLHSPFSPFVCWTVYTPT